MKKAPFACPKCGETKGWICLNDPTVSRESLRKDPFIMTLNVILFVLSMVLSSMAVLIAAAALALYQAAMLVWHRNCLRYTCAKCGYRRIYRHD